MQVELSLLIISLLFFISIFTDHLGNRYGVPTLLLFLLVGMLFGPDGLGHWLDADGALMTVDIDTAQAFGTIALCVILFSGGMSTSISDIRPVAGPGVTLATIGVLITAGITGVITYYLFGCIEAIGTFTFATALLIAATLSSTDSASTFSVLRKNNIKLKHNVGPLLELESGANDPMAYVLTLVLIGIVTAKKTVEINMLGIVQDVFIQLVVGAVLGFAFGKITVALLKNVSLRNESLYPIMIFSFCIFTFAASYYMKGNPYLAVYISGLVIGNTKFVRKRHTKAFFDGLTWLMQLVMFLMLGLMVKPSTFIHLEVWLPCLIISVVMLLFARPIAVWICMLPFGKQFKGTDKLFISWVGLKGAVPIIFAIMCEAHKVPHADMIFSVVFLCTLVSLLTQGSSLTKMAHSLHLTLPKEPEKRLQYFDIDLPDEIQSYASETVVQADMMKQGNELKDIDIPAKTLVIMVRRGNDFFIPVGTSVLMEGDHLLFISDRDAEESQRMITEEEDDLDLTQWSKDLVARVRQKFNKRRLKQEQKEAVINQEEIAKENDNQNTTTTE